MSTASIVHVALTGSARDLTKAFKEAELGADEAAGGIGDKFDKGSSRVGGIFHKMSSQLENWGVPFAGSLDKVGTHLDEADAKGKGFTQTLSTMGGTALAAGAAGFAAVAAESVHLAMSYDKTTSAIAASAGISQGAAKKIGDAFLSTAGTTTIGAGEIASAYASVAGQLGTTQGHALDASQALGVMKAAMDLAEASGQSLSSTTSALAGVMQAYGLKAEDAASTSDVLWNTANKTGNSIQGVANSFEKVKAKMGAFAPSVTEMGGLLLDMTAHGETGRAAMTALGSVFTGLITPVGKLTKTQQETVDLQRKLGVSFETAGGKLKPFSAIIAEVQPIIAHMGNAQATATLKALGFGSASSKILSTIQAGPEAYAKATAAVAKNGSAHLAAERATANLDDTIKKLATAVEDLGIKFGEALEPVIKKVTSAITDCVNWMMKHKGVAEALAGVLAGVVALAIGAFAFNMGVKLVGSISDAGKAMGNLISKVIPDFIMGTGEAEVAEEGLAATSEETGAASAAAFGPIGLAIMAIVAIGYEVVKHWKTILGWLKDVWNAIKGAALAVFDWLKEFFKKWGLYILGALLGPIGLLVVFMVKHWNTIKTDAVKIWNDVVKFLESIPSRIWNVFKSANTWLFDAGKNIILGLIHGVTNMAGKAVDAVKHIGSSILHAVTSFFGIFSPSKVFADIGGNLMLGLAGGINSKAGVATAAMDGVNRSLRSHAPASSSSRGGGSARGGGSSHGNTTQTITVNVATNADPHKIGREVGWAMKRHR